MAETNPPPEAATAVPPASRLDEWTSALARELGLDALPVDIPAILDVAREAAHAVDRPAAPISLFLVGFAAAQRGGTPDDVAAACAETSALALAWGSAAPGGSGAR